MAKFIVLTAGPSPFSNAREEEGTYYRTNLKVKQKPKKTCVCPERVISGISWWIMSLHGHGFGNGGYRASLQLLRHLKLWRTREVQLESPVLFKLCFKGPWCSSEKPQEPLEAEGEPSTPLLSIPAASSCASLTGVLPDRPLLKRVMLLKL